jgi:lipopolysaccharide cholinephosphotransferase
LTKDPSKMRNAEDFKCQGIMLQEVAEVMGRYGLPPILSDGVVLGIIREGDFIPWDFDGDFFVEAERAMGLENKLASDLKALKYNIITIRGGLTDFKVAVDKYDYHIDIRGFMRCKDLHINKVKRSNGKYSLYVMPTTFMDNLQTITFRGGKYMIPKDTEGYLTHLYGDWRTPKKTVRHSEYLNPQFKSEVLI